MGKSSGRRPWSDWRSTSMGSGRPGGAVHLACAVRETFSRKAFPAFMRASILGPIMLDSRLPTLGVFLRLVVTVTPCRRYAAPGFVCGRYGSPRATGMKALILVLDYSDSVGRITRGSAGLCTRF